MGFETELFDSLDTLSESEPCDITVGYIGTVRRRLDMLGKEITDIDYPEQLMKYTGRKIWRSTVDTVNSSPEMWPVFIKPVNNKLFKGRAVYSPKDMIGCGCCDGDNEVRCSEIAEFVSEYRVFVLYGDIIGVRNYGGDWSICCSKDTILKCISDFTDTPAAYAMDMGVTADGKTLLIEINNTCSIGSYGLDPVLYARFISARWAELTDTEDECRI